MNDIKENKWEDEKKQIIAGLEETLQLKIAEYNDLHEKLTSIAQRTNTEHSAGPINQERDVVIARRSHLDSEIRKISEALWKIKNHVFDGCCVQCGEKLPIARITNYWSIRCVPCEQNLENRNPCFQTGVTA